MQKRREIVLPVSILNIKEMKRKGYLYTYLYILANCEIQKQQVKIDDQEVNCLLGVYETSYGKLSKIASGNNPSWSITFIKTLTNNRLVGVAAEKSRTTILIPNYDLYLCKSVVS